MATGSFKSGNFEVPLDVINFGFCEPVKAMVQNMPQTNLEPMQYLPLDRSSKEIRILKIEPGITGSEIRCTLDHVRLQEADDSYLALSYTWGSQKNLKHVYCNGKRLSVTSNLHFALERCRERQQPGDKFWIDAICINQQHIPEREAQVSMMASIYRQARFVLVIMGESDGNAELVPPLMEKIHNLIEERGRGWSVPVEELERHGLPAVQCQDWRALASLFSSPWFRRIWIVQEVAMAKSISILYGNLSLDFEHLFSTAIWISSSESDSWLSITARDGDLSVLKTTGKAASNLRRIMQAHRVAQAKDHKPLSAIFTYSMGFEASDHRDLIYALFDLMPRFKDSGFQISYAIGETLDHVLLRFARLLVERKETWDLLMHSVSKDPYSTSSPSWVPELGKEKWRIPIHSFYGYEWNIHCRKQIQASVSKDGKFLTLRGKAVDSITAKSSAWKSRETTEEVFSHGIKASLAYEWEVHARSIASRLSSYPTGEPIGDVYLRTLTANRLGARHSPTSADLNRSYSHFLKWHDFVKRAQVDSSGNLLGVLGMKRYHEGMDDFYRSTVQYSASRILCVTQKGYMGLVPQEAREGDLIMGLTNTDIPLVFRKIDDRNHYKLLGDCYIHGYMTGELAKELEDAGEEMILI